MIEFFSKKIVGLFAIILIFVALTACSEEVFAQNISSVLPKIRIDEITTNNVTNNINGTIKISNLNNEIIPEYYLSIEINKQIEGISTEKIYKTILGSYSLNPKETKEIPYEVSLPQSINTGKYYMKVIAKSYTGIDISTKMKALDELSGNDGFLETYWEDARIVKNNVLEGALVGVNFNSTDPVTLSLKVKNTHNNTIVATPHVEIYARTDIGKEEPLISYALDPVEFTPGFIKMFRINLQKINDPESYYALVKMKDENQEIVAGYQEFRFVIIGNESAKILTSKFDKDTNRYTVNLIGPADGSTTKNPVLKITASDNKTEYYKDEIKIDYLGARTKEYFFTIKSKVDLPDSLIIKTEILSSSGKTLDTHTENVVFKMQSTKIETDQNGSGFNWFLVLFLILFAIIVAMLIYLKKRTNLVMIFIIFASVFFSSKSYASCQPTYTQGDGSVCDESYAQQPDVTSAEFNDSGAQEQTYAIGDGPTVSINAGGIVYSCSNNSSNVSVTLNCTGNTTPVVEANDQGFKQYVCKCTAPGLGGAIATYRGTLTANCWQCQNEESYDSNWMCGERETPRTIISPPISIDSTMPQVSGYIPNPSIPFIWPTNWPTNMPLPTTIPPTPTPSYISTAFPTNAPKAKAPGSITVSSGQTWRCLKSNLENADEHKLIVSGEGFPEGDYFIVGCLLTPTSSICTTGSDQNDIKIGLSSGNYTRVSQSNIAPLPYLFAVEPNSLKISNGKIEARVFSQSAETTTHFFYGVSLNTNLTNDEAKTLKYNTFNFNQDTSKCTSVRWDPTGLVFDANNYQPISNVSFTLLDKDKNIVRLPGVANIITSDKNGRFDFYIEPGIYYLKLNQNDKYHIAYENDLIRFEEKFGIITHVDIPVSYR